MSDEIIGIIKKSLSGSTSRGLQPGSPSAGWIDWAANRLALDLGLERERSSMNANCVRYVSKWELRDRE